MSNLRLLNETTISSSVSSASVTDVFSSDFDIYKISISDSDSSANSNVNLRFINSSGSIVTSSEYDTAGLIALSYASFSENRTTNQTHIDNIGGGGRSTEAENGANVLYIFNPFSSSSYTFLLSQASVQASSGLASTKAIGVLTELSSIAGFTIFLDSGTIDKMKFRTYGLRVDT
jgi:hypothetical protein